MKKNNNKGFTLMEMLIVVAIIAVLVAIAIPVFTNQLEKAREATDMANIRSAYAEVMATALTDTDRDTASVAASADNNYVAKTVTDGKATWSKEVVLVQKQDKWQSGDFTIGGKDIRKDTVTTTAKEHKWVVSYNEVDGTTTIAPKAN